MCKKRFHLVCFVLVLNMAVSRSFADVVGVGKVVMDGSSLVRATTADGYTVTTQELRTGTTTAPGGESAQYPPQWADDFDFSNATSNIYPLTTVLFGGEYWSNANGDAPDFFVFEAAGSRQVTDFRVLFPDDTVGEALIVQTAEWLNTGIIGGFDQPQPIAGIAFSITDLKDMQGNNLPDSTELKGIVIGQSNTGVDPVVIAAVMSNPMLAQAPTPPDGATDVPRDVVLSWTPGKYAPAVNGHKVYLSESFSDVIDGIGGITQDANSYDPGRLDFETTYYWRVDEVNAPPDFTIYKGAIWQFTVEPVAYAIQNITATASSSEEGKGPENTINSSGLDDSGLLHGNIGVDTMWLSSPIGVQPTWIEYEFDSVYKLHEMWAWNSNESLEPVIGLGLKDVSIEYSVNGTDYTTLGTTHEFARAPGTPDYAHNTTLDLGGVGAKYVKLTANSNWGGLLNQYGLSEVRFFYIPVRAREPNPDSGATDVDVEAVLSWRAGREAAEHNVYFGTDEQAVADGTATVTTVTETSHGPLSLDLGQTYYWKINEVNMAETPTTLEGYVWNFTTPEFLVVDDFESYNDLDTTEAESNRIFLTWLDGYEQPTNGSLVGYESPPFCEKTIVHADKQSMPLSYDNTGAAAYSEAERTFAAGQNWTRAGAAILVLYFHGTEGNTGQLYVKINGSKVVYDGDAGDIAKPQWQQWNIDLASLGVDLQNVTKLSIGIDGNGASGTLYIDDIRLYRLPPEPEAP